MRVIYIDGSKNVNGYLDRLIEGNIYDVVKTYNYDNKLWYMIKGHEMSSRGNEAYYGYDEFAPLSQIDETEMERSYGKQHA